MILQLSAFGHSLLPTLLNHPSYEVVSLSITSKQMILEGFLHPLQITLYLHSCIIIENIADLMVVRDIDVHELHHAPEVCLIENIHQTILFVFSSVTPLVHLPIPQSIETVLGNLEESTGKWKVSIFVL